MFKVPQEYTETIKKNIDQALEDPQVHPVAAFDADGTCWFSDVGRDFFNHQMARNFFPDQAYTWEHYRKLEKESMEKALLWMAQILSGFSLEEVRAFGAEANKHIRPHFIDHQKDLIDHLLKRDVDVYIVTASVKWTVEAAAEEIGIKQDHVLGIQTAIEDGLITDQQLGPLTWTQGKVDALLEATGGKRPFFASGNTSTDLPLLESSTHLRKVIHSAAEGDSLHQTELKALLRAKEQGWHFVDYVNQEVN